MRLPLSSPLTVLALATFALGACKPSEDRAPRGVGSAAVSPDAGAPLVKAAGSDGGAAALEGAHLVDLLFATPAVIAVSSKVRNPRDYPEHLIDRKPETAWNGRTGDLVGGWIAFRVPKDAFVDHLLLTIGFDHVASDGVDLFTTNHRIKRVRLLRDGAVLREHTFDVNQRKAQTVAIGQPGGEYKIEVLETVPGTKRNWRELTVSELHVMGTAKEITRELGGQPRVLVGSLDATREEGPTPKALAGFFPTIEALCKAQMDAEKPKLAEAEKTLRTFVGDDSFKLTPACKEVRLLKPPATKAPVLGLTSVEYVTTGAKETAVAVKTESGWTLVPALLLARTLHYDPGCASLLASASLADARVEGSGTSATLLATEETTGLDYEGDDAMVAHTREIVACHVARDAVACDKPVEINKAAHRDGEAPKWGPDAKYEITPDGHVKRP